MRIPFRAARAALLALALGAGAASAHEGHDHGDAPKAAPATITPRGTSSTDALELVAVARNGQITVFIDRAATNEPVTAAQVEAETPEGTATAAPAPDGSYRLDAHWSERPGAYDVLFTVTVDGAAELFPVSLTVPEPPPAPPSGPAAAWHAGLAVAHDFRQHLREADPMPFLVGGAGFLLGIAATLAFRRRPLVPAIAVLILIAAFLAAPVAFAGEGHDHGAPQAAQMAPGPQDLAQRLPDGSVFVPKPTQRVLSLRTLVTAEAPLSRTTELPGRVVPDPNASGVVQSSVGGRLSPPASGLFPRLGTRVSKGDVLATVTPPVQAVDLSDMRQTQGDLDQQIAITGRKVARYERLATTGAVAQTALEDARAELSGLKDRRAALDTIRRAPEELVAPVDGVVAERAAVAGQMAAPGTMVFRIVDPDKLYVEALSFVGLEPGAAATARLPDGRTLALASRGAGLADRNQAVPVQFAITGSAEGVRLGQFVTVLAPTGETLAGLAVPRSGLVRTEGGAVVYEHVAAERFEPRPVRVEPLDAEHVIVAGGLGAGRRVVVQGAELLDQVR